MIKKPKKMPKDMTVALLVGGWSAEREVSLEKGVAVEAALKTAGYQVRVVDVKKDLASLVQDLTPRPDAVFNNLYGRGGEDGVIQGILDVLGLPYTHSGVAASAVGMDKVASKNRAAAVSVRVPESHAVTPDMTESDIKIARPYVVKPSNEGSSVGISIVMPKDNDNGIENIEWVEGRRMMVEAFIAGEELTVAVLDGKAQAVTAIKSDAKFFDYDAKYTDAQTQYLLPAPLPKNIYDEAMMSAERVYTELGCEGLARCDFRYDPAQGDEGLYFLEINTQPGLTAESIGPAQVMYNGSDFVSLCAHLVETASCAR